MAQIRELVEPPLRHPPPIKSTGKTPTARATVKQTFTLFFLINGPVEKNSPSIFIDKFDSIAPKCGEVIRITEIMDVADRA